jgi:hypothetical protein
MSPSVITRPTGDSRRLTCNAGAYIVESSALMGLPSAAVVERDHTQPHLCALSCLCVCSRCFVCSGYHLRTSSWNRRKVELVNRWRSRKAPAALTLIVLTSVDGPRAQPDHTRSRSYETRLTDDPVVQMFHDLGHPLEQEPGDADQRSPFVAFVDLEMTPLTACPREPSYQPERPSSAPAPTA